MEENVKNEVPVFCLYGHDDVCGFHTEWGIKQKVTDEDGDEVTEWFAACTPHFLHYIRCIPETVEVVYVHGVEKYDEIIALDWSHDKYS